MAMFYIYCHSFSTKFFEYQIIKCKSFRLGRSRDHQILRQQPTARFMTKIFKEKSPPILKAFELGQKARPHISASPSIKKSPPL